MTETTNAETFASSHTRNLWDHRGALVDDVIKPAAMSVLLFGMVGDISAWWFPRNLITVVGALDARRRACRTGSAGGSADRGVAREDELI